MRAPQKDYPQVHIFKWIGFAYIIFVLAVILSYPATLLLEFIRHLMK